MAEIRKRVRKDGHASYQVNWVLGGGRKSDGQRQSETFTNGDRALAFKLAVEAQGHLWPRGWVRGQGYVDSPQLNGETFDEVATKYFAYQERRLNRGLLKPYTVHRYRTNYALHLQPHFGQLRFAYIEHETVEDWVDEKIGTASAKSIHNWHGVLFSIMRHGQKRLKLRPDNPCDVTELPGSQSVRQVRFFSKTEWSTFRAVLKTDVHLLVDVMLTTGMRWGEVTALRRGDITFPDGHTAVISITRAWSIRSPDDTSLILEDQDETKMHVLGPPKNGKSRHVVVTGPLAASLRETAEEAQENGYVFVTRKRKPWRYTEFHSLRWTPAKLAAQKAGMTKKVTPHMMRHTTVVWSLAEGVRIEVISEMLGHASIKITYDIYGGLIDLQDPVMATAMATAISNSLEPAPSTTAT